MPHPLTSAHWLREPTTAVLDHDGVRLRTSPGTDFWQRSYYGFRNDNAPALLLPVRENCTFTARATFDYRQQFDQAGVVVLLDSENWAKASIEYEDGALSRLGSVVTNLGYSDWATRDIPSTRRMWYRVSQRGPDFLVEAAADAVHWEQLRIFHLHRLGATTEQMGQAPPDRLPSAPVSLGIYACSPGDSSFEARFDRLSLVPSIWQPHG